MLWLQIKHVTYDFNDLVNTDRSFVRFYQSYGRRPASVLETSTNAQFDTVRGSHGARSVFLPEQSPVGAQTILHGLHNSLRVEQHTIRSNLSS